MVFVRFYLVRFGGNWSSLNLESVGLEISGLTGIQQENNRILLEMKLISNKKLNQRTILFDQYTYNIFHHTATNLVKFRSSSQKCAVNVCLCVLGTSINNTKVHNHNHRIGSISM